MKIGAFAKKHSVSIDTVRHYIDMQLLLAEKVGTQYHFTPEDSKDLEEILELKALDFSLAEIQNILGYRRLASNQTVEYRNHLRSFLNNKKEEVQRRQQELEGKIVYLEGKLFELEMEEKNKKILGLPISMIGSLTCPHCSRALILAGGLIENNMIITGKIHCSCQFHLVIENGIIIDQKSIRKKDLPTKKEYYDKTPASFINFIFKSMATLIKLIETRGIEKKHILEISNCCGFFLMQYLPYLKESTTYIVVDYDYKRLQELKNNLELHHQHNSFVFLCCNFDQLPLTEELLDLVIDNFSAKIHADKKGTLLTDSISPLLKTGGHLGGIYSYYQESPGMDSNIVGEWKDFYTKECYINMLQASGMKTITAKETGPITEGGAYHTQVAGMEYCHLIYLGKKESAPE